MKYNIGDKVTLTNGNIMTIDQIDDISKWYRMKEDPWNCYTDEMIEGLAEDESSIDLTVKGEEVKERIEIKIPEGYEYVIESGKIIFTKKKKEYPKTYEECCRVLGVSEFEYNHTGTKMWYRHKLMATLDNLMLCRDAYWKIAGEEMGLGKPWEPDGNPVYAITRNDGGIVYMETGGNDELFEFPTLELRDAFNKNFDPDIEICKEFL